MGISRILRNPLVMFWWLNIPLRWWMKVKLLKDNLANINPAEPILYILPNRSFSDLLVLYFCCKKLKLPKPVYAPKHLVRGGQAGYLYLSKLGLLQPRRTSESPTPLHDLCNRLMQPRNKNLNIQLVPVSIIWGRNPGAEKPSFLELLFADDEHAGILQKFFIMIAQGRNTVFYLGRPISLREQVDTGPSASEVAKKLRRVLRVHFRRQRTITLGPRAYVRHRVMRFIFDLPSIQSAIAAEAVRTKIPREKLENEVRRYLKEIAAAHSHSTLRVFDIFLTYVWQRIYDGIIVKNAETLRDVADQHEVIYICSHRSHLDYLILPYVLYHRGFVPPHTVAGVNLSFWPLGPILRKGGGFFVRRSFKGNRLYSIVFTEYINYLIVRGHPISFFPEGGRSRTGRLLVPRTGIVSMIVRGYLHNPSRRVAFVPVFISYDRVAEVNSYLSELRGGQKKKENFLELIKVWKVLQTKYGRAYLSFGKPVFLDAALDNALHNWRESVKTIDLDTKPKWLSKLVGDITNQSMCHINEVAQISPVNLVSSVLLSTPQRAISEEDLETNLKCLLTLVESSSSAKLLAVPDTNPKAIMHYCERLFPIGKFEYPLGGSVYFIAELDAARLAYYRNNTLHVFALPAIVATYLLHREECSIDELQNLSELFYHFLERDLYLSWTKDQLRLYLQQALEGMEKSEMLSFSDDRLKVVRSALTSHTFTAHNLLARLIAPLLDRYVIGLNLLFFAREKCERMPRDVFEKALAACCQKISLVKGTSDPSTSESGTAKVFLDAACQLGYIEISVNKDLVFKPNIEGVKNIAQLLAGSDAIQGLSRIFSEKGSEGNKNGI